MLTVLGPVGLVTADGVTALRGLQGALLAILAANHPNPVTRDNVIDALWPNGAPRTARNSLGVALHRFRSRLDSADMVVTEGESYRLVASEDTLDSARFTALVDRAEKATGETAARALREGLGLWRGGAFQPFGDDEAFTVAAAALSERRRHAEELLVDALLAVGQVQEAAGRATVLTQDEPYREHRWEQLMLALYRSGQQAEALRVAQRARTVLADDLGLDPGLGLQRLEEAILHHDPALLDTVSVDRIEPAEPVVDRLVAPLRSPPPQVPVFQVPFVGRESELTALNDASQAFNWVTVTGPPGVGKSRLVNRFALSESGRNVLWIEATGLTGSGLLDRLAKATDVGPGDGNDSAGRAADLGAISQALSVAPTLVIVDNADDPLAGNDNPVSSSTETPTISDLMYELARSTTATLLTTARAPLGAPGEMLLPLGPLSPQEAIAMLDIGPVKPPLDLLRQMVEEVGTLPLHLALLAAQMKAASPEELLTDLRTSLHPVGDAEAALDWSVKRHAVEDQELYDLMGIMGGWHSAADLAGVAGLATAEVRTRLKRLIDSGLARTRGGLDGGGATLYRQDLSMRTHARLRLEAAGRIEQAATAHAAHFGQRALDLGRAASGPDEQGAIEDLDRIAADLRLVLDHYLGRGEFEAATDFALALSEYVFFRLEYDKLGWHDLVLDAIASASEGNPDPVDDERRAALLAASGLAAWARDRVGRAAAATEEAVAVAKAAGIPPPLTALRTRVNLAAANRDPQATSEAMAALVSAAEERGTDRDRSDCLVNQAIGMVYRGGVDQATSVANQALKLAERSQNPTTIGWAKCGLGYALLLERPEAALAPLAESLRIARTVHNRWVISTASAGLATAARLSGRADEAAGALASLLDLWAALQKDSYVGRTLNEAGLVLAALDRLDDARAVLGWAKAFPAEPLLLPQDRTRLRRLEQDFAPRLPLDIGDTQTVVADASALLQPQGG